MGYVIASYFKLYLLKVYGDGADECNADSIRVNKFICSPLFLSKLKLFISVKSLGFSVSFPNLFVS